METYQLNARHEELLSLIVFQDMSKLRLSRKSPYKLYMNFRTRPNECTAQNEFNRVPELDLRKKIPFALNEGFWRVNW